MAVIKLGNKKLKKWPPISANITDIRIQNNQLIDIPDSIGNLTSLTRIIASNNQITDISTKLTKLPNLIDIRLDTNKINDIPEIIFNLTKLNVLIIHTNNIKSIPKEIGNLINLTTLQLHKNQLQNIPPEIGKLTNLTHLHLNENPIEYLPHSILKCSKLAHLDIQGTNLPIPPNYNPNNVKANIEYVLENQKEQLPELNIKKAFVFKNFSKPSLVSKFEAILHEYSSQIEVEFEDITDIKNINKATTVVLVIVGFDIHENRDLAFSIINKCKKNNVPYKILFQKDIKSIEEIHAEKGAEFQKTRGIFENKYKDEIIPFNTDEELKGLILNVLRQHSPEVLLKSLELVNISHFENINIQFDDKLTCIIGENGQGKSSILRALSLAMIGLNNSKTKDDPSIKNLLRIKSITQDGQPVYCETGKIRLNYSVDASDYYNEIIITTKDEGRVLDLQTNGDFELNSGEFNLKSLIVGFPQLRGRISQTEKPNKYSQPHIDDLIPLMRNTDDLRLDSFIGWIANLYGEAIKNTAPRESREFNTIEYVFDVISALTGKTLSFVTVQQFSPPIVIISSQDSPNGIPLNLISQGFKIVIGWIGYFIERKIEAFPISAPGNSGREKSILIIDEIDSSIHPVWQARLLSVLREKFPTTQIICTTHSPLMVAGLDRNQILEIKNNNNDGISVNQSSFDTWTTTYKDILKYIFDTKDFIPTKTIKELELELKENEDNPDKQIEIKQSINRLKENDILVDNVLKLEARLAEREDELENLIIEYSKKVAQ